MALKRGQHCLQREETAPLRLLTADLNIKSRGVVALAKVDKSQRKETDQVSIIDT